MNVVPKLLTQAEFNATRMNPKRIDSGSPLIDIWEYVAAIPAQDFGIADCRAGNVTHVYRMDDQYEHVLINSQYQGLAMVLVLDLNNQSVLGHHLLDINPPGTKVPEA